MDYELKSMKMEFLSMNTCMKYYQPAFFFKRVYVIKKELFVGEKQVFVEIIFFSEAHREFLNLLFQQYRMKIGLFLFLTCSFLWVAFVQCGINPRGNTGALVFAGHLFGTILSMEVLEAAFTSYTPIISWNLT